jgi:phosphoglycolate phosphatase-like HAD superfamily hydrolase
MLWKWVNSGTQVFILDLDGTLMPTAKIDNDLFWQAVFDCFEMQDRLPDSGILNEWCIQKIGRSPSEAESRQIKHQFVKLLEDAFLLEPKHFKPLPGVCEWLKAVNESDHVHTGIATGGWEKSARLKLKLSGLDRFDLPLASSDDAVSRTGIMQIAAQRILGDQRVNLKAFTYVGDGAWDLQASRELGWNFVGIADGARAEQLKLSGADLIIKNFCKI